MKARHWMMWTATCLLVACGSSEPEKRPWDVTENNDTTNNDTNNNDTNNTTNNDTNNNDTNNNLPHCLPHPPEAHRPSATECDTVRGPGAMVDPEHPAVDCLSDAECTDGVNGRCVGNGHDGYYCTYDACTSDAECGVDSVCECEGGWRSDHNVCLPGNCVTDADCGETGFCSPSQGDCGAYFGTVGYFCHTCADECVTDADCGNTGDEWGPYCMYDAGLGHWRCSESQCVG